MTKVIYFGNERLVSGLNHTDAPILRGLIEHGYDVAAVVSHHGSSQSRNQRELEVAKIANAHNIPLFLPSKPSEIIDDLRALGADIAVLAAYGRIISQQLLDIFPLGIVNIHPSLLPKYRGPTPIESAILNGESETGVSIMQLTAGMDEGPVYAQRTLPIEDGEGKFQLYSRVVSLSTQLFFETFEKIVVGSLAPTPQQNADATYSKKIQKSDGIIDWHESARQIEREIRAYTGWPQSRTTLGTIEMIITQAHTVQSDRAAPSAITISDTSEMIIGTADGALSIDALKPLGKKEMPVSAFLAGYRTQLGA